MKNHVLHYAIIASIFLSAFILTGSAYATDYTSVYSNDFEIDALSGVTAPGVDAGWSDTSIFVTPSGR